MAKGTAGNKVRTINCKGCGKRHTARMRPGTKYCSLDCYRQAPRPGRRTGEERACGVCGTAVYIPAHRLKPGGVYFCGTAHADEWQGRNKTAHTCKTCGGTFHWSPSRRKSYRITYCSLACRDADPARRAQLLEMNRRQQLGGVTSIERIGYGILDGLGVPYERQHVIGGKFCVDAFVPGAGLVVQFDGDYWHGHPEKYPEPDHRQRKRMALDRSQDAYMAACGFRVYRVWGSTLKHDPEGVRSELRRLLAPAARTPVAPA